MSAETDPDRRHYDEDKIEEMMQRVSTMAVEKAFKSINLPLDDKNSARDIVDLRNLINGWRTAKNVAVVEFVKVVLRWTIVGIGTYFFLKTGVIQIPMPPLIKPGP